MKVIGESVPSMGLGLREDSVDDGRRRHCQCAPRDVAVDIYDGTSPELPTESFHSLGRSRDDHHHPKTTGFPPCHLLRSLRNRKLMLTSKREDSPIHRRPWAFKLGWTGKSILLSTMRAKVKDHRQLPVERLRLSIRRFPLTISGLSICPRISLIPGLRCNSE
jgi:hypothetical protein